ncbi:Techylectin-5A, partial [Stegodyphus mimosarum]
MLHYKLLSWICMLLFVEFETVFNDDTIQEGKDDSLIKFGDYGDPSSPFKTLPHQCPKLPERPMDCAEVLLSGHNTSGVYTLWPKNRILSCESVKAYCDMDTDGGGWTVIQRRGNFSRPEDYFFKNWDEYKRGFGKLNEDFWFGNDNIYAFTNQKLYSVRFELMDYNGIKAYAVYDKFWIQEEDLSYRLHISGYYGNAGDAMAFHNNQKFSTKDRKNDNYGSASCAAHRKGAWWYKDCSQANLNGLYLRNVSNHTGVLWEKFRNLQSLKSSEIMIRPYDFLKT